MLNIIKRRLYQMKPRFLDQIRDRRSLGQLFFMFQKSALLDHHGLVSSFVLITFSTWKCSHWQGPHHQNECALRNSPLELYLWRQKLQPHIISTSNKANDGLTFNCHCQPGPMPFFWGQWRDRVDCPSSRQTANPGRNGFLVHSHVLADPTAYQSLRKNINLM